MFLSRPLRSKATDIGCLFRFEAEIGYFPRCLRSCPLGQCRLRYAPGGCLPVVASLLPHGTRLMPLSALRASNHRPTIDCLRSDETSEGAARANLGRNGPYLTALPSKALVLHHSFVHLYIYSSEEIHQPFLDYASPLSHTLSASLPPLLRRGLSPARNQRRLPDYRLYQVRRDDSGRIIPDHLANQIRRNYTRCII